MKEFIEKLIGRFEEEKEKSYSEYCEAFELYREEFWRGRMGGFTNAIKIVNELAEEYSKDQNWQTTRNYLYEKYFSKIRELSAKYNHPCENVPINFDWVFGLIEKIEGQLAEEYNNESVKGDLISRQAVLEVLEKSFNNYAIPWCKNAFSIKIKNEVISIPTTYNDGWIPVSSGKLPDDGVPVEVTVREDTDNDGYDLYVFESWYQEGRWAIGKNRYNPTVIAWKPKDAPYQPKGE